MLSYNFTSIIQFDLKQNVSKIAYDMNINQGGARAQKADNNPAEIL